MNEWMDEGYFGHSESTAGTTEETDRQISREKNLECIRNYVIIF